MNNKFNELFEQALSEFNNEHKFATVIVPSPLKEKFAKLIISECSTALSPMLRDMISRSRACELIKEHFGVKE